MNLRLMEEEREKDTLSSYACLSSESKGRRIPEEACDIRPIFQRDRDRILHCKAFRRLKDKTQVFLAPLGDHYRTRLTHTLEVSQIARTIARALRLNESLTEAIALGHDLGHTPFGHSGEKVLNEVWDEGFIHSDQSVRVVEILENKRRGLNLSYEVVDGIKNHRSSGKPSTLEGKVVQLSDKIAYINHDIDDAIRGEIITEKDIPVKYRRVLGDTVKARLDTLIHDIILNSIDKDDIMMSEEIYTAMYDLRKFMFSHVYLNSKAKREEVKAQRMLKELYYFYFNDFERLPEEFKTPVLEGKDIKERVICDYIAGMTDQYAIREFDKLFVPGAWSVN